MGGEPTLHPQFSEICKMLTGKIAPSRLGLWTSGHRWQEYKKLNYATFRRGVFYNDHSSPGQVHHPVLIAIEEVVSNEEEMKKLIDECPYQDCWSASINPKGAFFCEVAAALDITFDGPGGYPIEKGWWDRTPDQYRDQIEYYCRKCSGALPLSRTPRDQEVDFISPRNLARLQEVQSPKILEGKYELINYKNINAFSAGSEKFRPLFFMNTWWNKRRKKKIALNEIWLIKYVRGIRWLFYRVYDYFTWKKKE